MQEILFGKLVINVYWCIKTYFQKYQVKQSIRKYEMYGIEKWKSFSTESYLDNFNMKKVYNESVKKST